MATGNIFIDSLAGPSWLDVGGDRHITYFIDDSPLTHRLWTGIETIVWQSALQQWANVANITTERVSSFANADLDETWQTFLYMQEHHGANILSYHDLPNASGHAIGEYNTQGRFTAFSTEGLAFGGAGLAVFLDAIGHGLGLTSTAGFPDGGYDQELYSVMSTNPGPKINSGVIEYGQVATPMAFDIAAIQAMYGPNMGYRTGSDTYVLPDSNAPGTSWQCIWDAGGNDTIRYNGNLSTTIDLRAATLVNGDPIAGGAASQAAGIFGGYTIANGVVIENAIGGNGNDTLIGNSADNNLDGGGGDDTVIYARARASYTLTNINGGVRVTGPDGTDTISNVEKLLFSDAVVSLGPSTPVHPLFDTDYYYLTNPDVAASGANAFQHFNAFGWREGRDPDPFFDTSWYRAIYRDAANTNPIDHYHTTGWKKGYDPGPNFDTRLYLIHNPDVAAAGVDPLEHYLHNGKSEGRAIYAAIGEAVNGFDAQYYLLNNPDVAAAGVDPLQHFNNYGWHEGRNPNAYFDTAGYLSHYSDVAAAGVNPLQHYMLSGWREGRDPSAQFDTLKYLAAYGDVAAAGVNPFDHFLQSGIYEGRSPQGDGLWH